MTNVEWHPYPEESDKVETGKHYFVTLKGRKVIVTQAICPCYGYNGDFYCTGEVIAFAQIELPKPYRRKRMKNEISSEAN